MQQIRSLGAGESFSRTIRLDPDAKRPLGSKDALQSLRNSINQAVGRLRKEEPGSNFRVESASAFTQDHTAVLCTVAATRFDGPVEDDEEVDI